MSEVYIVCEGYHDRAFWTGWLMRLGCRDLGPGCVDPWGKSVARGHYGFKSKSELFVRVVPARGKESVRKSAKIRLQGRATKVIRALIANVDLDGFATTGDAEGTLNEQSFASLVTEVDAQALRTSGNHYQIDAGAVDVIVVRWQADDVRGDAMPEEQTLERLCCSAILDVHAERGQVVRDWLAARTEAPTAGPKEFAWSHMAGWYAENGCEDFYKALWRDEQIASALEKRLKHNGDWELVQGVLARHAPT